MRVFVALLLSGFLNKRSLSYAVQFFYFYAQTRLALCFLAGHGVVHVEFGLCARWKESAGRLWLRVLDKFRPTRTVHRPANRREAGSTACTTRRDEKDVYNTQPLARLRATDLRF